MIGITPIAKWISILDCHCGRRLFSQFTFWICVIIIVSYFDGRIFFRLFLNTALNMYLLRSLKSIIINYKTQLQIMIISTGIQVQLNTWGNKTQAFCRWYWLEDSSVDSLRKSQCTGVCFLCIPICRWLLRILPETCLFWLVSGKVDVTAFDTDE